MERRECKHKPTISKRAEGDSASPRLITGYAANFYDPAKPETEIELWQGVFERIMPGAFDRAIRERHDARGLFNHDENYILGRVASGTCRLRVDSLGLFYEIDENVNDPQAAGVCARLERGDVDGSSFAFDTIKDVWIHDAEKDLSIREIHEVQLWDVGPVVFPWYTSTTAGVQTGRGKSDQAEELRKLADFAKAEREKLRQTKQGVSPEDERARLELEFRMRQIHND